MGSTFYKPPNLFNSIKFNSTLPASRLSIYKLTFFNGTTSPYDSSNTMSHGLLSIHLALDDCTPLIKDTELYFDCFVGFWKPPPRMLPTNPALEKLAASTSFLGIPGVVAEMSLQMAFLTRAAWFWKASAPATSESKSRDKCRFSPRESLVRGALFEDDPLASA